VWAMEQDEGQCMSYACPNQIFFFDYSCELI
jgi:hypothetical protein